MKSQRFKDLNDDELYILKRAIIEAEKYIFIMENSGTYTDSECTMMNDLLHEIIDNIKERTKRD